MCCGNEVQNVIVLCRNSHYIGLICPLIGSLFGNYKDYRKIEQAGHDAGPRFTPNLVAVGFRESGCVSEIPIGEKRIFLTTIVKMPLYKNDR